MHAIWWACHIQDVQQHQALTLASCQFVRSLVRQILGAQRPPEAPRSFDFWASTPAMQAGPPAYAVVRRMCALCATNASSSIGRNLSAMMRCTRICACTHNNMPSGLQQIASPILIICQETGKCTFRSCPNGCPLKFPLSSNLFLLDSPCAQCTASTMTQDKQQY